MHDATVHILHAEEGVTSNIYGEASETDEVGAGREYFASILQRLEAEAIRRNCTFPTASAPARRSWIGHVNTGQISSSWARTGTGSWAT